MRLRWLGVLVTITTMVLTGCGSSQNGDGSDYASAATAGDVTPADLPVIPLDDVKASQSGSLWQEVANTSITVTYDRPVARGRELFGGIVAFGEVWNPGANDATAVEFSRDVTINGNTLAAGKYSLWAIPDPNRWTIIFSTQADVYHTPYPGEEFDALRFMASPRLGEHIETMAFYFASVEKKNAELRLHWGDTYIPFNIIVP